MNPKHHHYHTPLEPASTRVQCPVCHEKVYSRAGIHPQCAVRQSDPPKPKNNGNVNKAGAKPPDVAGPVVEGAGAVTDAVIEPPAPPKLFNPKRTHAW
jgi:hypothetical protein